MASVWSWGIILERSIWLGILRRRTKSFEREFDELDSPELFQERARKVDAPISRVYDAAVAEWLGSMEMPVLDREGLRIRLLAVMDDAISNEVDGLSGRLSILATVGAVAPFVGLFGTVWGIMRSFSAIAETQNTTLAVVAPGIAEALFATAVGLFAAIPAVIGYNQLGNAIGNVEAKLASFSVKLQGLMSRYADAMRID